MRILAVDPDLAEAGAAVLDRGVVVAVAVVSAPAAPPAPCPLRCGPVCAPAELEARGPLALAAAVLARC